MKLVNRISNGEVLDDILVKEIEDLRKRTVAVIMDRYSDGQEEEYLDLVESNYLFNKEKLAHLSNIKQANQRMKLLEFIAYLDSIDITKDNKLTTLLTTITLLSNMKYANMDVSDLYLLSTAMVGVPINNYDSYLLALGDEEVLTQIRVRTSIPKEQRKIAYEIQDYCDTFVADRINLKDIRTIIDNSNVKEKNKVA